MTVGSVTMATEELGLTLMGFKDEGLAKGSAAAADGVLWSTR
jgi:hypothetical protein